MRACLRTGDNQRYIARRTMAGVTRTIDVLFVLVPKRQEGDSFIIATARDITEMRQIEDQGMAALPPVPSVRGAV
jgi:hypothetical protein